VVLVGHSTVVVSGKLAQFGSRLLVPVSDMMLGQFAENFRAAAAAVPWEAALPAGVGEPDAQGAAGVAGSAGIEGGRGEPPAHGGEAALAGSAGPAGSTDSAEAAVPAAAAAAPVRPAPPPIQPRRVKEINALALIWGLVKGWFAGLFGKKHGS
jgi:hypothetical protein